MDEDLRPNKLSFCLLNVNQITRLDIFFANPYSDVLVGSGSKFVRRSIPNLGPYYLKRSNADPYLRKGHHIHMYIIKRIN